MAINLMDRVGKLINQAENASTAEEAEAFLASAQALATKYSIDLAEARHKNKDKEKAAQPIERRILIGQRGQKGLKTLCTLFMAIGRANDVKFDIAHNSTAVFAFGFAEDIDTTEMLYNSLVVQMATASTRYLNSDEHRNGGEIVKKWNARRGMYVEVRKKVATITARLAFQDAFARRVGRRLADAKAEAQAKVLEAKKGLSSSTQLALRDKALAIQELHKKQSTAKGSWKGHMEVKGTGRAQVAGDQAARKARLSGQAELDPAKIRIGA